MQLRKFKTKENVNNIENLEENMQTQACVSALNL